MTASQQCGGALHHIARPHQVIAACILVAFHFSPGDRKRSNEGAGEILVFMREQQAHAAVVQPAFVARSALQGQRLAAGSRPLIDVMLSLLIEGKSQSLQKCGDGILQTISQGQTQSELVFAS